MLYSAEVFVVAPATTRKASMALVPRVEALEAIVLQLQHQITALDTRLRVLERRVLNNDSQTINIGHWTLSDELHDGKQLFIIRYHPTAVNTALAPALSSQAYLRPDAQGLITTQFLNGKPT